MRNNRKTLVSSVYLCLFPWESFSRHTVFISTKDAVRYRLNSDCCMTILLRQRWEEGTNTMALIQTCQIQAIMTVPQSLSPHSCQTAILPHRGSPLRPFPRVPLCPLNIPKITIVHVIACSLNLHISYYCSSVFWEYGQRLVEYVQAIDPQNLSLSGHPLLQEA